MWMAILWVQLKSFGFDEPLSDGATNEKITENNIILSGKKSRNLRFSFQLQASANFHIPYINIMLENRQNHTATRPEMWYKEQTKKLRWIWNGKPAKNGWKKRIYADGSGSENESCCSRNIARTKDRLIKRKRARLNENAASEKETAICGRKLYSWLKKSLQISLHGKFA